MSAIEANASFPARGTITNWRAGRLPISIFRQVELVRKSLQDAHADPSKESQRPRGCQDTGSEIRELALVNGRPMFSTIAGFDIAGFGGRDEQMQSHVRNAMYRLLSESFAEARIPWPSQPWRDDRGDGALLTLPADIPTHEVIGPLMQYLYAGLRRYNKASSSAARIVLRMAVHSGHVRYDGHGFTGMAFVRLCRLLDAPAFKEAIATSQAMFGMLVSTEVYETVVQRAPGLVDPDAYRKLLIVNKETKADAWCYMPPIQPLSTA